MNHSLTALRVSNRALIFVLFAQFLCLLPLFLFLPIWMPALLFVSCFWRMQIIKDKWTMPHVLVKACLATGCVAGLYFSYGISISVDPLVGFLVCGVILKVIEAQKIVDTIVIIFVCLVIVAAQLLFSQSIGALLYALICLVSLVGALVCVWGDASLGLTTAHASNQNAFIKHAQYRYKRAGIYVLQALPIAALLFFVMPRLPPLWSMPEAATAASTGFSETMSPGDISQLSKSSKVAFRVSFYETDEKTFSEQPLSVNQPVLTANKIEQRLPNNKRYWRGLVLDEYSDKVWRRSDLNHFFYNQVNSASQVQASEPSYSIRTQDGKKVVSSNNNTLKNTINTPNFLEYRVLLEPHQNAWLFSLNKPIAVQSAKKYIRVINNDLIKAKKKVTSRFQYNVRSNLAWQSATSLSKREAQLNTRLPDTGNNRAKALITDWVNEGVSARDISNRILGLYQQRFTYTLNPPLLGDNAIDDFLFVSRRGFCEHFSSSYVYLMRLAGVPARVVVGYLGGRVNPIENYMTVRQSDAHAWAEVWFEGEGWVRVDPTAAVAPNRIEQNLSEAINELEQSQLAGGLFKFSLFSGIRSRIDAVSFLWHRYIVEFDNAKQSNYLSNLLGGKTPLKIAIFLLVSSGAIIMMFFFIPNLLRKKAIPKEIHLLKRFEKKCKKIDIARKANETPMELSQKVADSYPHLKERVLIIGGLFNQILYANNEAVLIKLERAIKYFVPSKRAMKRD